MVEHLLNAYALFVSMWQAGWYFNDYVGYFKDWFEAVLVRS